MIIENSCRPVTIHIPENCKTILLKMSGGADSSLMAYLLAKYKNSTRPDLKFYVMTVNNKEKFYQISINFPCCGNGIQLLPPV